MTYDDVLEWVRWNDYEEYDTLDEYAADFTAKAEKKLVPGNAKRTASNESVMKIIKKYFDGALDADISTFPTQQKLTEYFEGKDISNKLDFNEPKISELKKVTSGKKLSSKNEGYAYNYVSELIRQGRNNKDLEALQDLKNQVDGLGIDYDKAFMNKEIDKLK